MSFKLVNLYSILCLLCSCDNNGVQNSKDNEAVKEINPQTCYRYIKNRDTIILRTINVNGSITGTLVYNLYEKDKNAGTIQGNMKEDLLIADYSFESEGANSTRQVAFKKSGNNFIEGYGDIEQIKDKIVFKNPDSLNFNSGIVLTMTDCQK